MPLMGTGCDINKLYFIIIDNLIKFHFSQVIIRTLLNKQTKNNIKNAIK